MESEHDADDYGEERNEPRGKAIAFVVGGLVVVLILYLVATGRVEIFS